MTAWRRRSATAFSAALLLAALLGACARAPDEATQRTVVAHYVEIARATYLDSLATAKALEQAARALVAQPGPEALAAARTAWRAARIPYSQTEALRFGHWNVDDWETRVNAWPVDEGLLDYVANPYQSGAENRLGRANLVASESLDAGALKLDAREIGTGTLRALNGLLGQEANVATGYHAIEFLLWGQDLDERGPGARPWSDYAADARCTRGLEKAPAPECARRGAVLLAALQLLVSDLDEMARQWGPQTRGSYGARLASGEPREALRRMLFALGALAAEELAGERIRTALLTRAQEEEQDCFSDDTHHSLYYNVLGIENFYLGRYGARAGLSLSSLVSAQAPRLDARMRSALENTRAAMQALVDAADQNGQSFDRLIIANDTTLLRGAITALEQEAKVIEEIGSALGLAPLNPAAR